MHMSIFESYVTGVAFTAEQIAWLAQHKQHLSKLTLARYRKHYQHNRSSHERKEDDAQGKHTA